MLEGLAKDHRESLGQKKNRMCISYDLAQSWNTGAAFCFTVTVITMTHKLSNLQSSLNILVIRTGQVFFVKEKLEVLKQTGEKGALVNFEHHLYSLIIANYATEPPWNDFSEKESQMVDICNT